MKERGAVPRVEWQLGWGECLLERLCGEAGDTLPLRRVAVIVAHPDDEVIGAGARLPRLRDAVIISVTDGAPRDIRDTVAAGFGAREEYAHARRLERAAALALAGLGAAQVYDVGIVDQEASRDLVGLARHLARLLEHLRPEVVLTHAYEGGHPDHDATAFGVHAAARLMHRRGDEPPAVLELASYHEREGRMVTGGFAPEPGCPARDVFLSDAERALKGRMFDCYVSQRRVLDSFATDVERFRVAPRYDFCAPPPPGVALYDRFPWGVRSAEWRELARRALSTLRIAG